MHDVTLSIRQGLRDWDLGSEDAGTAANNKFGHVSWTMKVPKQLKPGRATLISDGAEPLQVLIEQN